MFTSLKYAVTMAALLLSANVMATDVTFVAGTDLGSITDYNNHGADTMTKGGVTISVTDGCLGLSSDYRCYKGQTLTVESSAGNIRKIEFTCTASGTTKQGPGCFDAQDGYSYEGKIGTWTGDAAKVEFKATANQVRATKIVVTLSDGGVFVAAPVISPAGGTYTEPIDVTITAESGLKVLYSMDNTTYNYYYSPIHLTESATVYAIAEDASGNKSSAVSATYTIVDLSGLEGSGTATDPYTASDANKLCLGGAIPADKVYVQGKISKIESIDVYTGAASGAGSYGNATYFISKDGTETDQFEIYRGYSLNGEKFTSSDEIKAGDFVIVYGMLKLYNNTTPEMDAGSSIFKLNDEGGVVVEPDRYETINAACVAATDTHKEAYISIENVVVTHISTTGVYVLEQATGRGFLLYGKNGLPEDLKVGDVLQGTVFGELYTYHGLPELTPSANGTALKVSENITVEPILSELSDLLTAPENFASMLISLEGFMFNETGLTDKAVTISQYGDEATLFDQFQILTGVTFDTDAEYTATFITSVRDGVLQLYPINKDEFGGGEVETPFYETIGAIKAAATADKVESIFKMNDMLVSYANGKSVYVTDGRLGFLLFASAATSYKAGDKLSGDVKGNLYVRYGVPQLEYTVADNNITVTSSGNEVTYPAVDIDMVNNNYNELLSMAVELSRVTITAEQLESKNVTIKQGDKEVVLRDNFGILSDLTFDTEAEYNIKVIVAVYVKDDATTIQVYPINRSDFVNEEYVFDGDGTLETPYSVADVIYMHLNSQDPADKVWVKGTIIGCVNGSFKAEKFANTQGDENLIASNIVLAPSTSSAAGPRKAPAEFDPAKCIPVELKNNTVFREKLNLVDNFGNLGKEVLVNGNVTAYFSAPGVKNLDDAIIDAVSLGVHGVELDKAPLSGYIYTVAGQRVSTMTRGGLYIIGGKKVLVK